jgi:hypothetical protein
MRHIAGYYAQLHMHNLTIDEGIKTSRFGITFKHDGLHTQATALGVVLLPIHLN